MNCLIRVGGCSHAACKLDRACDTSTQLLRVCRYRYAYSLSYFKRLFGGCLRHAPASHHHGIAVTSDALHRRVQALINHLVRRPALIFAWHREVDRFCKRQKISAAIMNLNRDHGRPGVKGSTYTARPCRTHSSFQSLSSSDVLVGSAMEGGGEGAVYVELFKEHLNPGHPCS